MFFEDNPFADTVNPYQYLEMQEEECWLQNMALLSRQAQQQMQSAAASRFVDSLLSLPTTQESLEFEPLTFESPAEATAERSLLDQDQETVLTSVYLDGDQQTSFNNIDPVDLGNSQGQAEPMAPKPRGKKGSSSISFNTTDYIIKHCFKKMLDEDFREQVELLCEENHLSYSGFAAFWKHVLKRYAPNKHIGLTRFMKMIGDVHPAVSVCRLFFSSYLMYEYPRYIAVGSMHNKQEYLRCATKLMYISCPPKTGSQHIPIAREP